MKTFARKKTTKKKTAARKVARKKSKVPKELGYEGARALAADVLSGLNGCDNVLKILDKMNEQEESLSEMTYWAKKVDERLPSQSFAPGEEAQKLVNRLHEVAQKFEYFRQNMENLFGDGVDENMPLGPHNGRIRVGDNLWINDEEVVITGLSFPGGRVTSMSTKLTDSYKLHRELEQSGSKVSWPAERGIARNDVEELPLVTRAREIRDKQKDLPRMDPCTGLDRMGNVEYTPEDLAKIDEDLVQVEMVNGEEVVVCEPERSDAPCTIDERGRMGRQRAEA